MSNLAYQAEWRELNREYVNAYWQDYREKHKPVKVCETAGCGKPVGWHKRKFCDQCSREYNEEHRKRGYYPSLVQRRARILRTRRRILGGESVHNDTLRRETGIAA